MAALVQRHTQIQLSLGSGPRTIAHRSVLPCAFHQQGKCAGGLYYSPDQHSYLVTCARPCHSMASAALASVYSSSPSRTRPKLRQGAPEMDSPRSTPGRCSWGCRQLQRKGAGQGGGVSKERSVRTPGAARPPGRAPVAGPCRGGRAPPAQFPSGR